MYDRDSRLAEREVSEGLSSKIISSKLNISKNTVDRHRQNIISKM